MDRQTRQSWIDRDANIEALACAVQREGRRKAARRSTLIGASLIVAIIGTAIVIAVLEVPHLMDIAALHPVPAFLSLLALWGSAVALGIAWAVGR